MFRLLKLPPTTDVAENFIENVIGYFPIPFGVATYFKIDGRDVFIPMAVEETSIIAAASASAKWIRQTGELTDLYQGATHHRSNSKFRVS